VLFAATRRDHSHFALQHPFAIFGTFADDCKALPECCGSSYVQDDSVLKVVAATLAKVKGASSEQEWQSVRDKFFPQ
jgi:hypothetical protein